MTQVDPPPPDPAGRRLGAATGSALIWRTVEHVGVRGVSLIRFLILARLLRPQDFGLLAIASVAVDFLMSLTDFGMVPALVQRTRSEPQHYDAAWTINLMRALMMAAVIVAFAPLVASLFGEARATDVLRWLALRPVLDATASIRVADLTRSLRFRSVTVIRLSAVFIEAGIAIALAAGPKLGVWALVIGSLTGTAAGSAASYVLAPYRPRLSFSTGAALPLFRFGRWLFLAGVLAIGADALLRAVVSRRLGATDLGIYYVAARVALLPYEVINELIGAVIFPVQARLQHDKPRAARVFSASLKATTAFLMLVYALLAALAASLVTHVLGSRWTAASPVIRILALVGVTGALWEPTTAMFRGFGRPQWVAWLYGVRLPLLIGLAWTLSSRFGVTGAAASWVIAEAAAHAGAAVFTTRLIKQPFEGMGRPLAATVAASAAAAATAVGVTHVLPDLWGLGVAGVLGLGVGIGVLGLLDQALQAGLRADITKLFPGIGGAAS